MKPAPSGGKQRLHFRRNSTQSLGLFFAHDLAKGSRALLKDGLGQAKRRQHFARADVANVGR